MQAPPTTDHDVVVIGGAFSGAATAILLKRWMPALRVLIVEKAAAFDQKVGEATVEVSAHFLHSVLGVYDELSRTHLPKHGLRYWFSDHAGRALSEMSEVGTEEVPRLPAFQLDRGKIDEHLLLLASQAGADVMRPAKVSELHLEWPVNRLHIESDRAVRDVTCRWVVDASGRAAVVARKLGLHRKVDEHPTAALWGRWKNIKDMDGPAVVGVDPRKPQLPPLGAARRLATNHFCGYGYWCWLIPLGGGETSIGVVYNKELYDLPAEGTALERYLAFVHGHPGIRELVEGATLDREDFRGYGHLPYTTAQYAARGWALVGDAASFMDPYYSPGLDHASMSAYATARIIEEDLKKRRPERILDVVLERHNDQFVRSYGRWLSAVYLGKYELFGDAELTTAAFLLDTALYYLGVFGPVQANVENLKHPTLGWDVPAATAVYRLMRFYNGRLTQIARTRRDQGTYGELNVGWRVNLVNVGPGISAWRKLAKGVGLWGRAEVVTAMDALRRRKKQPAPMAAPTFRAASSVSLEA